MTEFFIPAGSGSSSSVEQEIEHKCEMCGTEFVTATSLKIHRLKCDKQKKMACEFCLDEFRSETSLKMHKLICVKVTKNSDDNSKDVNNQNNDESNSNNTSSVFTRRHDPIREFFEKEERLKKEKDQQQQIKIRETNISVDQEKPPSSSNNTGINNIIEVLHQKNKKELELKQKQQQTKIRETNVDDQMEQLPVPGHSEKINKLTDQHVKERPVEKTLHGNPQMVVSKESSKIIKPIFQKEPQITKDQQNEEPLIVQKLNIKEPTESSGSSSSSSNFKNVPPKIDVEPKVQKLKIKLPKKPDIAQPIDRNPSDVIEPSTAR